MASKDNDEMTSLEIAIVAEAFAYAVRTPGTRVKIIDGTAVVAMGEASDEEMASLAAYSMHLDEEGLAAHSNNEKPTGLVTITDGKDVRTFSRAEWAEYLKQKSQ